MVISDYGSPTVYTNLVVMPVISRGHIVRYVNDYTYACSCGKVFSVYSEWYTMKAHLDSATV